VVEEGQVEEVPQVEEDVTPEVLQEGLHLHALTLLLLQWQDQALLQPKVPEMVAQPTTKRDQEAQREVLLLKRNRKPKKKGQSKVKLEKTDKAETRTDMFSSTGIVLLIIGTFIPLIL